jgi:hypothetical protein
LTRQATRIPALEADVTRLVGAALDDNPTADWMRRAQARIHREIQAIRPLLSGKVGQAPHATPTEQEIAL